MRHLKITINCLAIVGMLAMLPSAMKAQDVHFSQFYNSPLSLNPAMTGLFLQDYRVAANYRNQWSSVTTPYETMSASVDFSTLKGILYDDFVGVGLMVLNDKAGDLNLRNTQVQLSASYSKALNGDGNHYMTAGVQIGGVQRAFNSAELRFDSQYDGTKIDQGINSGEVIDRPNFYYADVSAGLAWFYVPDERSSFYFGLGMAHLNRPNVSFYSNYNDRLHTKFTLHGGIEFPINSSLSLVPRAVIIAQGPYVETNVGGLVRFAVHPDYGVDYRETAFYIGAMFRVGDAFIPMFRLEFKDVSFTASYDANISNLESASGGNGGFEISAILKQFLTDSPAQRGPIGCPTF